MTLKNLVDQLFVLAEDKQFNHRPYTKEELTQQIRHMMPENGGNQHLVMEILLPDGWWHFMISYLPGIEKGFFDYEIPDDREHEARIMADHMIRKEE